MNEQKIAARLRKKDEKALEEAIKVYSPLAAGIIKNLSRGSLSKEDIEEVIEDTFFTLWKNSSKIIDEKLKGYICSIAKTKTLDKLSNLKGAVLNIEDYEIEDDFSISDQTEAKDIARELNSIISTISEPDKEILMRYYFYYQSTTKIAGAMKINIETVKYRLKRTREKLRITLTERGYST